MNKYRLPKNLIRDIILFYQSGNIKIINEREYCLLRSSENSIYVECSDIIEVKKEINKDT